MDITTRIIKGGALLAESRVFIDGWDLTRSPADILETFRRGNLLAKRSRARAEDALAILRQRFSDPGPHVIASLKSLTLHDRDFRDACFYEAARNDDLLAHVVAVVLARLHDRGRRKVELKDIERALLDEPPSPVITDWSEGTRRRVIQGLVSSLRDFGVLTGRVSKSIAQPTISLGGFVYVLGRLRERLPSTREIVFATEWRWWLLHESDVRSALLEADREGVLRFADAGSTVRIDWRSSGLEEMVRAVA